MLLRIPLNHLFSSEKEGRRKKKEAKEEKKSRMRMGMAQLGEEKREHPAKRLGGWTSARVESAPQSVGVSQARSGGQRSDR